MSGEETKVLLAGCGSMSRVWLDAIKAEDGVSVAALVDARRENALERARQYGVGPELVFDDLEIALDSTAPDAVFDCTPPEAHFEVTMKALSAGCHVLGEKPLADTMEHARSMVCKSLQTGRLYAVMQNRRYLPTAPAMAGFVKSGVIGRVTTVNADFYMGAHFTGFRTQMQNPLLLDMAIHTFDQARQFAAAEPLRVYCKAFNPEGSWYRGKASAMCIFEMSDDIVFNYRGSWCSEGFNTAWAGAWRVVGTGGTVLWEEGTPRAQVVVQEDGFMRELKEVECTTPPLDVHGHSACIREFLRCMKEGVTPATVCSDNIKSLAMVFAAIESDSTGRPVDVCV